MATTTIIIETYEIKRARGMHYLGTESSAIVVCRGGGFRVGLYFLRPGSPTHDNIANFGAKWATMFLPEALLPFYVEVLRSEKPAHAYLNDVNPAWNRIYTGTEPIGEEEEGIDLAAWLDVHRSVRNAIVWETPAGAEPYASWSATRKAELRSAFRVALTGESIALTDPPPNKVNPGDDEQATTVLAETQAWPLYLAYVANSLAVQIGGWVGWSLLDYTNEELSVLLDSREFFLWDRGHAGYRIEQGEGRVVPAPPAYTRAFLVGHDAIQSSRRRTIGGVLEWCRTNMVHFTGSATAQNLENQFGYRGYPPVSRTIEGTVDAARPDAGKRHRTAGCRGTTGFLKAVLRAVNIPVRAVAACGHVMPHFLSENVYLTHGDDPYNAMTRATPPYSAVELLTTHAKFQSWFGAAVPSDEKCDNVGRRVRELAIEYLPNYLLHRHCGDKAAGREPHESEVFETFQDNYTLAELQAADLWTRMDDKIDSFGGCAHVP